jgi:hypothetical protein
VKIFCIFVQTPCAYPGEYAPELYAAADEWTNEANPDYLNGKEREALQRYVDGEYTHVRRVAITVPDKEFGRMFFGESLAGSVQEG